MKRYLFLGLLLAWMVLPVQAAEQTSGKTGRFLGTAEAHHPDWFRQSFLELPEDVAELAAENRRLLLYFYQNGCPYCAKLVNETLADEQVKTELLKRFDLLDINMWGDREVIGLDQQPYTEKTLAAAYRVQFTPTLIFLDKTGKPALRVNGYRSPQAFLQILRYLDQHPSGDVPFGRWLKAQKLLQPEKAPMVAEPFLMKPPYMLDRSRIPAQRPLLVMFEYPGCQRCEQWHADLLKRPEIRQRVEKMDVVQLDATADTPVITPTGQRTTARAWAEQLNINDFPTLALFDVNGQEIIRTDGMLKGFHTMAVLEYALSGAWKTQPSFQRFIEHLADEIRAGGEDVNIWY